MKNILSQRVVRPFLATPSPPQSTTLSQSVRLTRPPIIRSLPRGLFEADPFHNPKARRSRYWIQLPRLTVATNSPVHIPGHNHNGTLISLHFLHLVRVELIRSFSLFHHKLRVSPIPRPRSVPDLGTEAISSHSISVTPHQPVAGKSLKPTRPKVPPPAQTTPQCV